MSYNSYDYNQSSQAQKLLSNEGIEILQTEQSQIHENLFNNFFGENKSVAVRGVTCLVLSIVALIQLFTGCALYHHKGAGVWCILIIIILGVLFQVFAIALFIINQLHMKFEDKQSNEEEDWEELEKQETPNNNQIKINQQIIIINQAIIFIIGFFYFILSVIFIGTAAQTYVNSSRLIWLILVILGLIMTIGVSIVHIFQLPKYVQDLSLISIVLYPCLGLAFIFTGTKLLHASVDYEQYYDIDIYSYDYRHNSYSHHYSGYHYDRHFSFAWIFFIVVSYLFHSLSFILLVVLNKRIVQIRILLINFFLGLIYSFIGVIFNAVSRESGTIWLFVSVPGIVLIISSVLIILSWQPFFNPIIRGFVIAFCTNDNKKPIKKSNIKKKQVGLKLKKKTFYTAL